MVLGKQFKRDQFILVYAIGYYGLRDKVRCNLVDARSLEGLGTLGKLGLEGLLLFMYPNLIL